MLVQQVRQTPGQMRRMKVNQPTGHINLRPIFTIIGFYRLVLAALLQTIGLLTHIFFRSDSLVYRPQSSLYLACVSNRSHGKRLVVDNFRPISIINHFTFLGTYRFCHIMTSLATNTFRRYSFLPSLFFLVMNSSQTCFSLASSWSSSLDSFQLSRQVVHSIHVLENFLTNIKIFHGFHIIFDYEKLTRKGQMRGMSKITYIFEIF